MTESRLELRSQLAVTIALVLIILVFAGVAVIDPSPRGKIVWAVVALAVTWLTVKLARRRMVIDDRQIWVRGVLGERTIAWDEVNHYTYWSMGDYYLAAGAGGGGALAVIALLVLAKALGKGGNNRRFRLGRLTIVGRGGHTIVIDTRYRNVTPALDRAFAELHGRLRQRPARNYAPFQITDTELIHANKGAIGLADIDKISAAQARISVSKRGKRLAWVRLPMRRVSNVMLFLEELAERGLIVNAHGEVFVPPPVLTKLNEAASRQAALPRAEIHRR